MTQVSFKNACILVTLELSYTRSYLPLSNWSTLLSQRCGLDLNRAEQKFKKKEKEKEKKKKTKLESGCGGTCL